MRSINQFVCLALLALPAFATPLLPIRRAEGEVKPDSYIVMLKDGYNISGVVKSMTAGMNVTDEWDLMNGFAVTLSGDGVEKLKALPGVSSVDENSAVNTSVRQ